MRLTKQETKGFRI